MDTSDDSKDYLTLHGGHRGPGEMYYCEAGHSAAQRTHRYADLSTSEIYLHIKTIELSDIGSEVFRRSDNLTFNNEDTLFPSKFETKTAVRAIR